MKNYRLKIFCDFDGTITKNDVWMSTIVKFIKDKEKFNNICEELYSGKIGTRETVIRQLELVEDFSFEKFDEYLGEEEIDEHFKEFVDFCRQSSIDLVILSGGLDYYIDHILKRENIQAEYYSCRMNWNEESKKLKSEFIYSDEYCRDCDTCKRNILISNTNDLDNDISVYIGDGSSDFCVSGFADVVFAKGQLASYCWKNNITYFDYKDFSDVKNKLIKILEKNKLKHRQEAKIRRRDVIMGG